MSRFDDSDDDSAWDETDDELDEEESGSAHEELQAIADRAEEMAESGDLRRPVKLWRKNMDRFADEPLAYFHYGQACFRLLSEEMIHEELWETNADIVGFYEEALSALEEAVSMEPEHHPTWNIIGALYALRGNRHLAIDAWEKSLAINPSQPQVREDLATMKENLSESP